MWKKFRNFYVRWTLTAMLAIIPRCPHALFPMLARTLYFLFKPLLRRDTQTLKTNAKNILGLTDANADEFAKECLYHQIICGLETIKGIMRPETIRIEGLSEAESLLRKLVEKDKGTLVISAHCGSWELAGQLVARFSSKPTHVLAKPARQKFLINLIEKLRGNDQKVSIIWNNDPTLLRKLIASLKKHETIGFVMDQRPNTPNEGTFEFFGRPTPFVGGPAKLAVQYGCSVMSIYVLRRGPFYYECQVREIPYPEGTTPEALSQVLVSDMEKTIRANLTQWTWNYRRWNF